QAEDGIRDFHVTGVQTCALPILLYAKQAFAEGEGPSVPAEPRHWVEPDPVVYARLGQVATLVRDGFESRDLLTADSTDILDRLEIGRASCRERVWISVRAVRLAT